MQILNFAGIVIPLKNHLIINWVVLQTHAMFILTVSSSLAKELHKWGKVCVGPVILFG